MLQQISETFHFGFFRQSFYRLRCNGEVMEAHQLTKATYNSRPLLQMNFTFSIIFFHALTEKKLVLSGRKALLTLMRVYVIKALQLVCQDL